MSVEGRGKRPYKVWDSGRQIRKGLVAGNVSELVERGREKLDLGITRIRVVLEADGTQVEDADYFHTLPENTVFLLLRQGEHWYPAGVEVLRQGSSSPRKPSTRVIVSGIGESTTQRQELLATQLSFGSTASPLPSAKSPLPSTGLVNYPSSITTIHRDGKKETMINDVSSSVQHQSSVISQDSDKSYLGGMAGILTRQGSSVDSAHSTTVHIHTPECCSYGHPTPTPRSRASPPGDQVECDFHCVSLHDGTGHIHARSQYISHPQVSRPGVSSPVREPLEKLSKLSQEVSHSPSGKSAYGSQKSSAHVHFSPDFRPSAVTDRSQRDPDSSESETENTTNDEDGHISEKFLLLIDQPSSEQIAKKHLSIKDIGVILDRLSSKIVDVERLDRESDGECFNWTIKATIKGDALRELGVLYGGHYYTICEHPEYSECKEDDPDEDKNGDEV